VGMLVVASVSVASAHGVTRGRTPGRANGPHAVTLYLDRDGDVTDDGVEIPAYRGGDRTWSAVVACVQRQYAPFAVDVVDRRPASGEYITAVIGGRASLLGLDDHTTNGVGPYSGSVIPDAVVHVFSEVGTGERDVENLCAVTAHEVGHALGLDHEVYCGDIMSYYLDRCGARRFVDADAPCGEHSERSCGSGDETQNSYRRLGELVGFRDARRPQHDPWLRDDPAPQDPYDADDGESPQPPQQRARVTTYTVRRGNRTYRVRVVRR